MVTYERQKEILRYLAEKQFATIKELSSIVWSSESSVRRDVKFLQSHGYVSLSHGGVILETKENRIVHVSLRDTLNSSVKEALAKKAASYIFDGATVFIDGSSTVRRILKYIKSDCKATVISNNRRIFSEAVHSGIQLYCTGGYYLNSDDVFVGCTAENYIRSINADLVFFSSQGLSEDGEISDSSEEETSLRKAMLSRSKKSIFLCDSSKLGQKRTFTLCHRDDVDVIICDNEDVCKQ
jgi:DeoR/GlpR family transcriptional regulator of sugar metabolism